MENLIENIKIGVSRFFSKGFTRKKKHVFEKSLFCSLGFHKMICGFGWSLNHRMDVCKRENCSYRKWHRDKIGAAQFNEIN